MGMGGGGGGGCHQGQTIRWVKCCPKHSFRCVMPKNEPPPGSRGNRPLEELPSPALASGGGAQPRASSASGSFFRCPPRRGGRIDWAEWGGQEHPATHSFRSTPAIAWKSSGIAVGRGEGSTPIPAIGRSDPLGRSGPVAAANGPSKLAILFGALWPFPIGHEDPHRGPFPSLRGH